MISGIKYQPQHSLNESAVGLGRQARHVSTASLVQHELCQHSCNHISWAGHWLWYFLGSSYHHLGTWLCLDPHEWMNYFVFYNFTICICHVRIYVLCEVALFLKLWGQFSQENLS